MNSTTDEIGTHHITGTDLIQEKQFMPSDTTDDPWLPLEVSRRPLGVPRIPLEVFLEVHWGPSGGSLGSTGGPLGAAGGSHGHTWGFQGSGGGT